jgi:RNA ligase (TIGR02306 family)
MERKLVTIQEIASLSECNVASDNIVVAKMSDVSWNVIVKRDEFVPGDKCVYFEIDSILPETPWAEFMRARSFRVKSMKMRGTLSQGLIISFSSFGEKSEELAQMGVGTDVTEFLGVIKFEPPMPKDLNAAGAFPSHLVPKTDEMRIQTVPKILDELKNHPFYVSVKLDGQSGTFIKHDGKFMVCSRNMELKEGNNSGGRLLLNTILLINFQKDSRFRERSVAPEFKETK